MRLKFIAMGIREFKSFTGKHVFRLDVPAGLHFIRGNNRDERRLETNGVGKTSLWDAFLWCLFGRTVKGLRNPDVVPWSGKKGTRVTLRLSVDGAEHRIVRTASPHTFQIDDVDVGPEAVTRLIGMTYELMTATVIMGQDCPLFFDMTPMAKMELLSDVKGLDRWDDRSKAAGDRVRTLETEHAMLTAEVAQYETMVKDVGSSLAELKPKAAEWDETYEKRRDDIEKLSRKLKPRIEALDKEVITLDLKYDGAATEARACARRVAELGNDCATAAAALARLQGRYDETSHRLADVRNAIDKLAAAVDQCPMCGSPLKAHSLDGHRDELDLKRRKLERAVMRFNLRPLKATLEVLQSQKANQLSYLDSFTATADGALREFQDKKAQLIALQEQERQTRKSFDENERNPYTAQVQTLRKRQRKYQGDLEAAQGDARSCARELERARFWPKGFKDVKLHIIRELLQELDLATMGLLEEMGLVGWQVKYAIERETKSGKTHRGLVVLVGSPKSGNRLVRWESWSGGEMQRLRVVGALALSSVLLNHAGVRSSLEVLDEQTKYMSGAGVSDLCSYLSERAKGHNLRIFYVDHQCIDAGASSNASTITINRDREGSWIEQEHA